MHKHFTHILLILTLAALLAGCMAVPADPTTAPAAAATVPTTVPTETTSPTAETLPAETVPTEAPAAGESTEPDTTVGASTCLPYLLRIERCDQSIYDGPGYDYGFVGTVRERGTYTIVEESEDYEGNLWGRLKSGIGWVDLTEMQSEEYQNALISANYADENLMLHGAYHHYASGEEYSIPIAFRAYGRLRDVALFHMEFSPEGYFPGADIFTLEEMTEDMPLVAELAFPGDMTMYGIRFTDEDGIVHQYSILISGRNGTLILTEE